MVIVSSKVIFLRNLELILTHLLARVQQFSHLLALCHIFSAGMVCMLYSTFLWINHHTPFLGSVFIMEVPIRACFVIVKDIVFVNGMVLMISEICKHYTLATCGVYINYAQVHFSC